MSTPAMQILAAAAAAKNCADSCSSNEHGVLKIEGFEQKFVWTIENISKLLEKSANNIHSPIFHLGTSDDICRFYLTLSQDRLDNIGVYVNLDTVNGERIVAHFCIFIYGIFESKKYFLDGVSVFDKANEWGRSNCIKKETLLSESHGYVDDDDKLAVHCVIQLLNDIHNVHTATSAKHRRLVDDFEDLVFEEKFSDLTLVVSGENFPVHRNLLAQRCKYFEALLSGSDDKNVKQENNIDIENVSPDVFREVLRFIYCGQVNDLQEIVMDLLVASETYYMRDLKILCEGELLKNLCAENAVDYLVVADRHKLNSLKMHSLDLIGEKSNEVVKTEGYKALCDSGNSRLLGEAFSRIAEVVGELKKLPRAGDKRKHV